MATATASALHISAVGDRMHARAKITESGSYVTGGTDITAAQLGLRYIYQLFVNRGPLAADDQAWDGTPGTTVKVKTFTDANPETERAQSATSSVYFVMAIGV